MVWLLLSAVPGTCALRGKHQLWRHWLRSPKLPRGSPLAVGLFIFHLADIAHGASRGTGGAVADGGAGAPRSGDATRSCRVAHHLRLDYLSSTWRTSRTAPVAALVVSAA